MAFQVSPGIQIREIDLTTVTPAVSSTEGAIAGVFSWGPVEQLVLVDSENTLVQRFGKPTNNNFETFFTAASFLSYGNKLYVVRAANTSGSNNELASWNAIANTGEVASHASFNVKNSDAYEGINFSDADLLYVAKYPGSLGNSLKISVCDSNTAFSRSLNLSTIDTVGSDGDLIDGSISLAIGNSIATVYFSNTANSTAAAANTLANNTLQALTAGDIIELGNSSVGIQYLKVSSFTASNGSQNVTQTSTTNLVPIEDGSARLFLINFDSVLTLNANVTSNTFTRNWEYYNVVNDTPKTSSFLAASTGNTSAVDEVHVVVVDEDGLITGVPGTILEAFEAMSRVTTAKKSDGTDNYYKNVINQNSAYVWFANDRAAAASANTTAILTSTNSRPLVLSFVNGTDGQAESNTVIADLTRAYDLLKSPEDVDVSLILAGKAIGGTNKEQLANYIIDNVAEFRKDCMVFISPDRADVVRNATKTELSSTLTFRRSLRSTTFAVMDSGYKYMYDKYNDVYRYVPLNGDVAGAAVFTDETRDPWFSPAGFNRGQVRNIIKLAYNPNKADRDQLYKEGINPVVTFPGQGTILFGDKTLANLPSAFDRINVRRLFIILEKAISRAAKSLLFEFNDEFTRAQFRNIVEPFLRDVQGRRGITDFKVVCDETNNPPSVIDRNEFVGDIYIKPARSINFIQLNFVAVRTGVEFSEIVGSF